MAGGTRFTKMASPAAVTARRDRAVGFCPAPSERRVLRGRSLWRLRGNCHRASRPGNPDRTGRQNRRADRGICRTRNEGHPRGEMVDLPLKGVEGQTSVSSGWEDRWGEPRAPGRRPALFHVVPLEHLTGVDQRVQQAALPGVVLPNRSVIGRSSSRTGSRIPLKFSMVIAVIIKSSIMQSGPHIDSPTPQSELGPESPL